MSGVDRSADVERAKAASLRLLTIRARSRAELKDRLKQKGFSDKIIREALAELASMGLVNDKEFARLWVESRLRLRPAGAAALRWELRRRGISGKMAAEAVEEAVGEEDELRIALELARLRLQKSAPRRQAAESLTRQKLAQLGRFLSGRGFSYEVVRQVINTLRGEEAENEP